MDELVDAIHTQANRSYLVKVNFRVFRGELRFKPMEEDEDEAQPISSNDEVINIIL